MVRPASRQMATDPAIVAILEQKNLYSSWTLAREGPLAEASAAFESLPRLLLPTESYRQPPPNRLAGRKSKKQRASAKTRYSRNRFVWPGRTINCLRAGQATWTIPRNLAVSFQSPPVIYKGDEPEEQISFETFRVVCGGREEKRWKPIYFSWAPILSFIQNKNAFRLPEDVQVGASTLGRPRY